MVWAILIGVAVVLVVFLALVAMRPAAYRVERKVEIVASPDRVFAVLNDLREFARVYVLFGNTWDKLDPSVRKTFDGPSAGVGQTYAWGGKDVGKGKLTIEESVPAQKVAMKLEFFEPMASLATVALTLASASNGTLVTWTMAGNHNFIGKAFGVFADMDKMLGRDIEMALAQLKRIAEAA